jgi:hypothetical protein
MAYYTISFGGAIRRVPIKERLRMNVAAKEKIYKLVNEKHRKYLPDFEDIKKYLTLHWCFVAMRNMEFMSALGLAFPVVFSYNAWKLIFKRVFCKIKGCQDSAIHKTVLF